MLFVTFSPLLGRDTFLYALVYKKQSVVDSGTVENEIDCWSVLYKFYKDNLAKPSRLFIFFLLLIHTGNISACLFVCGLDFGSHLDPNQDSFYCISLQILNTTDLSWNCGVLTMSCHLTHRTSLWTMVRQWCIIFSFTYRCRMFPVLKWVKDSSFVGLVKNFIIVLRWMSMAFISSTHSTTSRPNHSTSLCAPVSKSPR